MKRLTQLLFLVGMYFHSYSQSLSPSVVSSSGSFTSAPGISLSATVGEMTMVETFSGGSYYLTQGFQQPNDLNVNIPELPKDNSVVLYPNPNSGSFYLMLKFDYDSPVMVKLYDALGRVVYLETLQHRSGINQFDFHLGNLVDGIYWMELRAEAGSKVILHDTQKINIIH